MSSIINKLRGPLQFIFWLLSYLTYSPSLSWVIALPFGSLLSHFSNLDPMCCFLFSVTALENLSFPKFSFYLKPFIPILEFMEHSAWIPALVRSGWPTLWGSSRPDQCRGGASGDWPVGPAPRSGYWGQLEGWAVWDWISLVDCCRAHHSHWSFRSFWLFCNSGPWAGLLYTLIMLSGWPYTCYIIHHIHADESQIFIFSPDSSPDKLQTYS